MTVTERTWNSDLVAWIKEAVNKGETIFQDATTEMGIAIAGATTKFPDVLLILNRTSYEIFNGWELKFPDVPVDDPAMLANALVKARQIKSNSIVTWNASRAVIWQIVDHRYSLESLKPVKEYPPESGIFSRADLSSVANYQRHQPNLRARLMDILHDLEQLKKDGIIKPALNIRTDIVGAITDASDRLIPLLRAGIQHAIDNDVNFRAQFGRWKILEGSTLKILEQSSRKKITVHAVEVLARFAYYKLIGKILFYKTLAENLSGRIPPLSINAGEPLKPQLDTLFARAREIDYQAVFDPDFTDNLSFSDAIDGNLKALLNIFAGIDFRYLPNQVIGYILENLVPKDEKRKFGQYFTPEKLAYLVSLPAVPTATSLLMDPTSGTGSFLTAIYSILKYRGRTDHGQLLQQVWGNDISHFPALLSVINLYKQDLSSADNFPRVMRRDYFSLQPGMPIRFPDPANTGRFVDVALPSFDAIVGNFPFIQQEDHDNDALAEQFKQTFGNTQPAFIRKGIFTLNERSDYFIYCFYHALTFLKPGSYLSAITSNAWLAKNYGTQFKKFLLDNFSIRMVVKSNAEHWFQDSKVSTIYLVLRKTVDKNPTRFVTLNFKIDDYFPGNMSAGQLGKMEDLYNEIANCELPENKSWEQDNQFAGVYHKKDKTVSVSMVDRDFLLHQVSTQQNWAINFIAQDPLAAFNEKLVKPYQALIETGRGTRANTDEFQILSADVVREERIESEFLVPAIKSSKELDAIHHTAPVDHYIFYCTRSPDELREHYPGAFQWIQKFSQGLNKTGKPYPEVLAQKKPYWYTLIPEKPANIFITIGPANKLFFSYADKKVYLNQRLIAIRVPDDQVMIMAALLNCIVTLLMVEMNGIPRAQGVLDLNADFFKSRIKFLNPALLSGDARQRIIDRFELIANRPIEACYTEFRRADRKAFDEQVFQEFGIDTALISRLYDLLIQMVADREEMKER